MTASGILKNPWPKLDKILGLAVVVSVFCLIFVTAHRALFDLDIWLHLKTGEFILQNKIIPSQDIFSFSLKAKPWVDHEWLFQALAYLIYSKWQAEGLILLQCYMIILSFFVLFLMGQRSIKSYMEVAVFILVAAYASLVRFNIRPDIFSMLFFALDLYLLRFHSDKKGIWLLLPIQVLWVNLHGYFFLGPLLVSFFILAEFFRRKIKFLPWQWKGAGALSGPDYKRLKMIFLFIVFACLFNPRGWSGAVYPFNVFKEVMLGESQIFFRHIQELQPALQMNTYSRNFHSLIIFFCFALMAINFKRLKLVEVFLVSFFFLFALTGRNVAFFAFVGYLVITSYIGPTLKRISENFRLETPLRKTLYFLLKYGLALVFIVWVGLRINSLLGYGYYDFAGKRFVSLLSGIDQQRYPKGAVDFVLEHNLKANLFNDFNSGAYLIGIAYPKRKVFIDGRTELYGADFFKEYQAVIQGDRQVFARIMDKYEISAILLSTTSASLPRIISYLYKSPQWKMVFFDETGLVFLKDTPLNKELIRRYEVDFKRYPVPIADLKLLGLRRVYPAPYIKRASLFALLQEEDLVMQEAKEALRIMPNCAKAYHLLGEVYLRKGLYPEALENFRAALLLTPRDVEALVDLGACLKELKDDPSARRVLKGAIKFNRRYAPAYYQLGCIYLMTDNHTQAIEVFNKAVKYAPDDPLYHFKLAEALFALGKSSKEGIYMSKARAELKKAEQLNIQADPDLAAQVQAKLEEIKNIFSNPI